MQTQTRTSQFDSVVKEHGKRIRITGPVLVGYTLLAISFSVFVFVDSSVKRNLEEELLGIFFLHYLLPVGYSVFLIVKRAFGVRKCFRPANIHTTVILVLLYLISAYALNRVLPVFERSTPWLCAYLTLTSVNLLSFYYYMQLPKWANRVQEFLLGSAMLLYLYMMIYVIPYYGFGSIGLIVLGIGGHIFVPLVLFVTSFFVVPRAIWRSLSTAAYLIGGVGTTIFFVTGFVVEWNTRVKDIQSLANRSVLYPESGLPVWVNVGQSLKNDWITEKILKSNFVYSVYDKKHMWRFDMPRRSWTESKKHDPLVFISTAFTNVDMDAGDRIKVLQAIRNGRHQSNERLWNGENLSTSYVVTDVDIFPDLHLAYTEKYFTVRNDMNNDAWWGTTQEAIYTFQLPEGSVVTSLSLWINGKEEKAVLTSKQKASKAYHQIVGVESRDPSVVHWQEGNTVTVRVFPCTPEEERKFKIGVTTPLVERDKELVYKNIVFEGPSADAAPETIRVRFVGMKSAELPGFSNDKNGDFVHEGNYDPDFEISLPSTALRQNNLFQFRGYAYSLKPLKVENKRVTIDNIYADINNTWTEKELFAIKQYTETKKVFVEDEGTFVQLTQDNLDIVERLKNRNFTLFPFHRMKKIESSIVVTKGKPLSTHLSDIAGSQFARKTGEFFSSGRKAKVFNIGDNVSTYISTFREFRGIEFTRGTMRDLDNIMVKGEFPLVKESDSNVVLHDAAMTITRQRTTDSTTADNAPDHLARLFAYNDVLRKVGHKYFENDYVDDALVNEASEAYVVSPVSSLIVLETEEDYKRFDIEDNKNSLQNASKESSGAVPEPHEWALIALFILMVVYLKFRK